MFWVAINSFISFDRDCVNKDFLFINIDNLFNLTTIVAIKVKEYITSTVNKRSEIYIKNKYLLVIIEIMISELNIHNI